MQGKYDYDVHCETITIIQLNYAFAPLGSTFSGSDDQKSKASASGIIILLLILSII